jgi:hypothetical protein
MTETDRESQSPRKKLASVWGELSTICRTVHTQLHVRGNRTGALALLGRLERILRELPRSNVAIILQEGLALYYQLRGEIGLAIEHRKKEIKLTERLQKSVRRSVSEGRYDERFAERLLRDCRRDTANLEERRAILRSLQIEHERVIGDN